MRKSHRQKVADHKAKRSMRWRMRRYPGVLKIVRERWFTAPIEPPAEWAVKGAKWIRENVAGQDFVNALTSVVGAGDPERFLSSFESLNPGLLERVRPSLVLHDDAAKVCPNCDGTGWSYHEHLPIERNVGCEDCGGCGDERGTGIIP